MHRPSISQSMSRSQVGPTHSDSTVMSGSDVAGDGKPLAAVNTPLWSSTNTKATSHIGRRESSRMRATPRSKTRDARSLGKRGTSWSLVAQDQRPKHPKPHPPRGPQESVPRCHANRTHFIPVVFGRHGRMKEVRQDPGFLACSSPERPLAPHTRRHQPSPSAFLR